MFALRGTRHATAGVERRSGTAMGRSLDDCVLEGRVIGSCPGALFQVPDGSQTMPAEEMRRKLRPDAEAKVTQRAAAGLSGYRVRPDSYRYRVINGREALTCLADYTQDGREMV